MKVFKKRFETPTGPRFYHETQVFYVIVGHVVDTVSVSSRIARLQQVRNALLLLCHEEN